MAQQPAQKPIFVATHSRSCSTAFERIFMTCHETITCFHEPFGDSFYYGPERISPTYMHNEAAIKKSGFENSTYDVVLRNILDHVKNVNKRVFIKDIAYHIVSPIHTPVTIAPSLRQYETAQSATRIPNPAIVPSSILSKFQFTFLIRDPRTAISSLYRCTVPPLNEKTGMHMFLTSEIGYREMRLLLDYLYEDDVQRKEQVCLVDADDLLDDPSGIVKAYCERVNLPFSEDMLKWGSDEDQARAKKAFAKYYGYHEDAIESTGLKPRLHPGKHYGSPDEEDEKWRSKYGEEGARKIREVVDASMADYEYLKQFALKASPK